MYHRFICGQTDAVSGLNLGVFGPAFDIVYDDPTVADWLWCELRSTLDWFNDHLDRPGRFHPRRRRGRAKDGVCWFRTGAQVHIAKARHLAWLVSEHGIPVWEVRAINVGEVVFGDDHQIVAAATREGPVFLN